MINVTFLIVLVYSYTPICIRPTAMLVIVL